MTPSKHPSYMVVRPSGIHFRIRVPLDIRALVGKKELRRSLTSLSHRAAQLEAHRLSLVAKSYFESVRNKQNIHPLTTTASLNRMQLRHPEIEQFSSEDVSSPKPPTLSTMITAYSEEHVQTGNWAQKTEQENAAICALFVRIVSDMNCNELSYQTLRQYKATLIRLPANLNKSPAYRDKTIADVIKMDCDPMAINNMNKSLSRISSLLRWGVKNGFIKTNFAEGLQIQRKVRSDQERSAYTDDQLREVFKNPLFTKRQFRHSFQYWLPLLGLFTGARLNELCQLYLTDIRSVDNIWILDINSEAVDKKLKTLSAARFIPIHSELLSLGFLDHVNSLRNAQELRVFPELKLSRDGYAQKASKWYGQFRKTLNLSNAHTK